MSIRGHIYKTPMINGKINHDAIIPYNKRDDFVSCSSEQDLYHLLQDISNGPADVGTDGGRFIIDYDAMDRLKEKYIEHGEDRKVIEKYLKQTQFLDDIVKQYGQVYIEFY